MKKLLLCTFIFTMLAVISCKQDNKAQQLSNIEQNDSLQKIIAQKDSEINDMLGTLNEIQ